MEKIKKTNALFVIALLFGLILHFLFVIIVPFTNDEGFYITIPFRLLNGDSLVQHEWHLTQFSSLFSYIPVCIWTAIKGSADSIFIFLRFIYLLIHTAMAVVIYKFFKKYGKWAILASMVFYMQMPYRILAISYQSMYVVFLLLLSLCLISIYHKKSVHFCIFAGVCFGCCCVCNPLFCFAFALYLLACTLWTKRQAIMDKIINLKSSKSSQKDKKLTKRQKRELKKQGVETLPDIENYNCFFTKEAILRFSCGIFIVAIVAVIFFISTGGTVSSLLNNIENLLGSSEYDIASYSIFDKLGDTIGYFTRANLYMPFILPAIFIALLFDKKKKDNKHRLAYLSVSLIWAIIFIVAVLIQSDGYLFATSLPFCVISTVCYLLTENKNKPLFYCMYMPCLIATVFQYLAADTHLATIGIVLVANNVPGVFFAMDLLKEMRNDSKENPEITNNKNHYGLCRNIIIISFCIQILFYGIYYQYGQISRIGAVKATTGPYAGLYMTERQYNRYNKTIQDLDYIKSISGENSPVLLATYENWMYLHLDRPFATYTTWYRGVLNLEQLKAYYKENPEKSPKYVYIESSDTNSPTVQITMDIVGQMFIFTKEDLSNGALLIIEGRKY